MQKSSIFDAEAQHSNSAQGINVTDRKSAKKTKTK